VKHINFVNYCAYMFCKSVAVQVVNIGLISN